MNLAGERLILSMIEMTAIAENKKDILELLRFSVERLRTRTGCLSSAIYETSHEKETILYLERWRSAEEFHRHIQSNLYLGVLNAIDLADGPPEISFYEISDTKSIELIVALRSSGVA